MNDEFFKSPILNSPYHYPDRHWELDESGQPTQEVTNSRRRASYLTPIPKPRKQSSKQRLLVGLTEDDEAGPIAHINDLRAKVDQWRKLKNSYDWRVTPETARLLRHWRTQHSDGVRPFFCQIEAVETLIWLTETAPVIGKDGKRFLSLLDRFNTEANPGLNRLALKMATGSGKTTVMAMIIAWQTINAVRRPHSTRFTKGFLIITPGLTIKDRLRVLYPTDLDNYYRKWNLVPDEMHGNLRSAKIVITNYHAFKRREKLDISRGTRNLLAGRTGQAPATLETEGEMMLRVMGSLMGMKNVMAINDEAHHCYREKPNNEDEGKLTGDDKAEAEKNRAAARLWISGLETVSRSLGIGRVVDLSATPFFLRGSGYPEGTLFSWTMSDFSLMDAIECGIVKLPRVPVADNLAASEDMPTNRDLWNAVRKEMPKKGRGKAKHLDPRSLPLKLLTAAESLYGHYKKTFDAWNDANTATPPCFVIVCSNTSVSKLIYDYVSGFIETSADGSEVPVAGKFELFRNYDESGQPLPRPRTLLIDSEQLESGEALDTGFREAASEEIDAFRRELVERSGAADAGREFTDQDLLREVMNTVGKEGRLGDSVRCVVSVSMLTEGWDANTVTHILGVRAFGTQLLCEQVVGRALRRLDYQINDDGRFSTEYADVFGIPFDFTAHPVVAPPKPPAPRKTIKAVPDRASREIRFPRVAGYRVEFPTARLRAKFNDDSVFTLTPELVGPTISRNEGIIGEGVDISLEHLDKMRSSTILFRLTEQLMVTKWRDTGKAPRYGLFNELKRLTREWLDSYLKCEGDTYPGLLMYKELAGEACNRITDAINRSKGEGDDSHVKAIMDPYNPEGSTSHVHFTTSKSVFTTDSRKCHINKVPYDSNWEAEFCRVAESHRRVICYAKNHGLGFEVPYRYGSMQRTYIPDFILKVHVDGTEPINLICEVKGIRGEDSKDKRSTMDTYWIPGINRNGTFGKWAFAEFDSVHSIKEDLNHAIKKHLPKEH